MSTEKIINTEPHTTAWVTNSNDGGGCVEMRRVGTKIELRDTKDREGGTLTFTLEEIHRLFTGVQGGTFDHLVY